jgi:hypothetical protein
MLRQAAAVFSVVISHNSPLENEGSTPHFLAKPAKSNNCTIIRGNKHSLPGRMKKNEQFSFTSYQIVMIYLAPTMGSIC